MRVQSNGKVRRTAAEWDALLAAQRASGLSEAAFCRQQKISKSSFSKVKQRRGRLPATRKVKSPTFVELSSSPVPERPAESPESEARRAAGSFELLLPGGVVLRWKA